MLAGGNGGDGRVDLRLARAGRLDETNLRVEGYSWVCRVSLETHRSNAGVEQRRRRATALHRNGEPEREEKKGDSIWTASSP